MSNIASAPADPTQPTLNPANPSRSEQIARYKVFRKFAYDDQYSFYLSTISRNRQAAIQVNRLRATMSLLTGLASALAGLIVQLALTGQNGDCFVHGQAATTFATATSVANSVNSCAGLELLLDFLLIMSVLAPAIGGGLNILSDLYQWDRLISIYDSAQRNMKVAYSRVPENEMPDPEFSMSINLFTTDTLNVMYEEAGQWGQSVHSPSAINSFLAEAAKRATDASNPDGSKTADADSIASTVMTGAGNAQATSSNVMPGATITPIQPITPMLNMAPTSVAESVVPPTQPSASPKPVTPPPASAPSTPPPPAASAASPATPPTPVVPPAASPAAPATKPPPPAEEEAAG